MHKYNCIFLDRDGTLNPDSGYISSINKFSFYDFTISSLKKIADIGNRFCIVTNQSGVSRGLIQMQDLLEIHDHIAKKFQNVDYAEDYLWWIIVMKRIKKTLFIKKNLTFIRVMNKSRTYKNIFKNLNSLNYIYKNILKLNYLQIFVIYILLIIKNLNKKYFFYFK